MGKQVIMRFRNIRKAMRLLFFISFVVSTYAENEGCKEFFISTSGSDKNPKN